jgi:hypothetical protein
MNGRKAADERQERVRYALGSSPSLALSRSSTVPVQRPNRLAPQLRW